MKLMSACSSLIASRNAPGKYGRTADGNTTTVKYMEPFENHYLYRHAVVDDNLLHWDISLQETWATHRWDHHAFAFIRAITEVNVNLGMHFFVWKCGTKLPRTFT
jgi:hypothetical protein